MRRPLVKIDEAARQIQPLVLHGDPAVAKAAHDALNALTSAYVQLEMEEA